MRRLLYLAILTLLCLVIVGPLSFFSLRFLSAESQEGGRSVMRITENTTLHVYNDGTMETVGGGVEYIPLNQGAADPESAVKNPEVAENIPVTRVKTADVEPDGGVQPLEEAAFVTITYIARGTLSMAPDGTWITHDGGQVEFIRIPRSEYEALANAAPTEPEVVEVEIVPAGADIDNSNANAVTQGGGCTNYQAISYFTRGSNLKRTIDYCVNSAANEIVKRYRLKNIGSADSSILDEVLFTRTCPPGGMTTVVWTSTGGPWVIAPNATLEFTPWVELSTGTGQGGVYENWLSVADTQSCFG